VEAELARRALADNGRSLVGWSIGVGLYVILIAAIFPSFAGSGQLDKLLQRYPDALKSLFGIAGSGSLSSGAGFLDAELFSFMIPLLVLVLAVGTGARIFAGEEDAGRLELVLAYPVRRSRSVLAKGAAVAVEVIAVSVATGLALAVADPIFDLDLAPGRAAGAAVGVALLGTFYGLLALSIGAATGNKPLAVGVSAGYAAAAYLVSGLHAVAGWLDPFRFVSPFWWIGSAPLQHGIRGAGVVVLLSASAVALIAGAWLVDRRDLEVP
jgi:ABC-2 type transport system permease protein